VKKAHARIAFPSKKGSILAGFANQLAEHRLNMVL
jgi:hypothetical protein